MTQVNEILRELFRISWYNLIQTLKGEWIVSWKSKMKASAVTCTGDPAADG